MISEPELRIEVNIHEMDNLFVWTPIRYADLDENQRLLYTRMLWAVLLDRGSDDGTLFMIIEGVSPGDPRGGYSQVWVLLGPGAIFNGLEEPPTPLFVYDHGTDQT